jgi:hypothetical protein
MTAGNACSIVHNENLYASGCKKRPRGPRRAAVFEVITNLNATPQHPFVDLKTQALMYYSHYHLQTLKDATSISKGVTDDFLPIWMSRVEHPMVDLAVSSLALAVFSRTHQHPSAAIEASMKYNQLLRVTQKTIGSLNERNINAYLLAIFFMSRYEDAVHHPSHFNLRTQFATRYQSFSHHDGALAIIRNWKDCLSHGRPATDIIKHTRRSMIKSALLRNFALPDWMIDGASFGEHGLELEYDWMIVKISSIRHGIFMLLKEKSNQQDTYPELTLIAEKLNKEAQNIDKALQAWSAHFPIDWCYQRNTLSDPHPAPARGCYSSIVYIYSSLASADVWNIYYATRILLNSTRLKILNFIRPDSYQLANERLECHSHLRTMANDLAFSVPYSLQGLTVIDDPNPSSNKKRITLKTGDDTKPYLASMIAWPLTIASTLGNIDIQQSMWFRSELAHIGKILGIGVLESVETCPWLEL